MSAIFGGGKGKQSNLITSNKIFHTPFTVVFPISNNYDLFKIYICSWYLFVCLLKSSTVYNFFFFNSTFFASSIVLFACLSSEEIKRYFVTYQMLPKLEYLHEFLISWIAHTPKIMDIFKFFGLGCYSIIWKSSKFQFIFICLEISYKIYSFTRGLS